MSIQETNYNNILIFMIPIPLCSRSRQYCFRVCIYQECQLSPFICNHCEDDECQTIHRHHKKQATENWSQISSLIEKYIKYKYSSNQNIHIQEISQYNESNQYIIRCLQNRQYSNIMGKYMRSLYDSMGVRQCTKTKKQVNQFQSRYQYKQYKEQTMVNSNNLQEFYISEGQEMFKQKKYQNAIESFEKVIDINKNNCKVYRNLLKAIKQNKKQDYFIQKYSDQIKINPDNSVIYLKRGFLYFEQQKFESSLQDYDKAIQLDVNYSVAYNYLANAKYCLKQYQQSFMAYSKAIELNPKYSNAYYNRARLCQKNDIQKALSDYNKAIEFDPKYCEAYNNRALIYQKKRQWQLAVDDYTKAIQLNPMYSGAFYNRGIVYDMKKQIQKALIDYTKAIQLDPFHYKAHYNRALIHQQKKLIEQALGDYNKAIQINPNFIDAYGKRADLYNQKKQYNLAFYDCNKIIQLNPNCWLAYNNRSLLHQIRNQLQMALEDLNKAILLRYSPKYLLRIGELYFRLHKNQEAEAQFLKYILLEGYNNKCYYYLGRIELQKRNLQLSSSYLEKSIQVIAQTKPQYFLYLAIVKNLMQENDIANDNYEIAFDRRLDKNKCLESLKQIYKEIDKFRFEDD